MYWSAICTAGGFIILLIGTIVIVKSKGEDHDFVILGSMLASVWTAISFFLLVTGLVWHIILSIIGAFK